MSRIYREYFEKYYLFQSGSHSIYKIPAKELINLHFDGSLKQWSKNRPADEERVSEIKQHYKETHHVDGTIRLAFINGEGLVCYESNHRRLALIEEIEFVLVDMLWDVTQKDIINEFTFINKAISVPELYVEIDFDAVTREKIINFVKGWTVKYKAFISTSARPNRPQFNRDVLTQEITTLWKEFNCPIEKLLKAIETLNDEYGHENFRFDHSNIKSPKILEKCKKGGLWLFAIHTSLVKKDIETLL
jgi:hypothetical protein